MPVMDDWLSAARDRLAEASGLPADGLELTPDMEATLLDLARLAAHERVRSKISSGVGAATAHRFPGGRV